MKTELNDCKGRGAYRSRGARRGHGARQAVFAILLTPLLGGAGVGPGGYSASQHTAPTNQPSAGFASVYFAAPAGEASTGNEAAEGRVAAQSHWAEFAPGDVLREAQRLAEPSATEEPVAALGRWIGSLFGAASGTGAGTGAGPAAAGGGASRDECNRAGSARCPEGGDALFLEACNEGRCYSAVMSLDLLQAAVERQAPALYLSALSTAIANEWAEQPATALGEHVQRLAHQLLSAPAGEQDYPTLLGLDLHNNPEHLGQLARPALLAEAEAQIAAQGAPTIGALLATAGLQTRELSASESFVFSSSRELAIDVDISARRTAPTFLSVCGNFTRPEGTYRVNYADCQLKAPLRQGRYTGSLRITGGVEQLLVILMPLENPNALEYVEWSLPERDGSDREAVLRVR